MAGAARRRGESRLWLPDLALAAAWVTLIYCLFLFQGYQKLFRDSDSGWHIRAGERILATHSLPLTDPYSFTAGGLPWFAWEWLADVATAAAHQAAGLSGVAMLYGLAIALSVWLWFRLHWAVGGNFLLAAAMAPLLLSTTNIHWLARPHVWSWSFLLATLLYFEAARRGRFGVRDAAVVAVGSALWANMHASFFLAPLAALLYAGSAILRPLVWNADRDVERSRAGWYLRVAAVAAAASFANPYGWQLHRHVFAYLTDSELLSRIGEFQSFDFHAAGAGQLIAALLIGMVGGALALGRRRVEHFALALAVTAAALRSARALPLAALLLLPLANGACTAALASAGSLAPRVRAALDAFLAYSANLRRFDARAGGWAVAWTVPALCWLALQSPAVARHTGFPPDQFPVAGYERVAALPEGTRLFAPDKFGGYLIYRYHDRASTASRQVFFDGRSDLYGARFLRQYGRMAQVRPGWQAIWDSFGFTHALLPNDYSLLPALEARNWTRLYQDSTATLLAAPRATGGTK